MKTFISILATMSVMMMGCATSAPAVKTTMYIPTSVTEIMKTKNTAAIRQEETALKPTAPLTENEKETLRERFRKGNTEKAFRIRLVTPNKEGKCESATEYKCTETSETISCYCQSSIEEF